MCRAWRRWRARPRRASRCARPPCRRSASCPPPNRSPPCAALMDDKSIGNEAVAALGRLAQQARRQSRRGAGPQSAARRCHRQGTSRDRLAWRPCRPWPARGPARSGCSICTPTRQLPDDLDADAGRLLRNSPYVDLRNKALIAFPPPGRLDPKKLPSIAALAHAQGRCRSAARSCSPPASRTTCNVSNATPSAAAAGKSDPTCPSSARRPAARTCSSRS